MQMIDINFHFLDQVQINIIFTGRINIWKQPRYLGGKQLIMNLTIKYKVILIQSDFLNLEEIPVKITKKNHGKTLRICKICFRVFYKCFEHVL